MKSVAFCLFFAVGLTAGAYAQNPVSDSDFISVIHPVDGTHEYDIPNNNVDTNFAVAIMIDPSITLGAISIPLTFAGLPELNIDTTMGTPPDIVGVTYGPAGRDPGWTLKSSFIDNAAKTILLGFVAFSAATPGADTLCYLHWDLDASGQNVAITPDTTPVPPSSGLSITDADLISPTDYIPQWTSLTINVGTLDISDGAIARPQSFELEASYPNPFNASTNIRYALGSNAAVTLTIHNILGQRMRTLVDRSIAAGKHEAKWDGRDDRGNAVASGVYLIVLRAGGEQQTRRALLLK
jgi:hypothetical protein